MLILLYNNAHTVSEMNPESEEPIRRPQFLSRILDYQNDTDFLCMNTYKEFLTLADTSTRESISSNIAIAANFKIAGPPNITEFTDYNDNLVKVFSFYCKIQQSVHGTFSSTDLANQTMNFKKFEIFCRDFKLIPKLLTRDDIKLAWEMMAHDWVQSGKGTFVSIGFNEFKDIIVRMALIAYHKPGLKKLILSLEGFMPQNVTIVSCFCNYMHLDDVEFIANYIRTVGRKTQGEYNFKSKGDKSGSHVRTMQEIIIDKEARKFSQINLAPSLKTTTVPVSVPPVNTKSKPTTNDYITADDTFGTPSKSVPTSSGDTPKKGYNAFGEKIKVQLSVVGANPRTVIAQPTSDELQTSAAARRAARSRVNTLPPTILSKLRPGDNGDFLPPIKPEGSPRQPVQQHESNEYHHHQQHRHVHLGDGDEEEDEMLEGSLAGSQSSSNLPSFIDNSLECLMESLERDYDPLLIKQLARYCYVPPKVVLSDTVHIGGPFADLGLLTVGSKVTINLSVTNSTADELHIDATTRNFKSHDTDLKTFSKALIPGFTRSVQVNFTVEPGKKTVLAFIDIISIAVRRGENSCISCPVFYRVDPDLDRDRMPRCTSESLQDLLGQYRLGRERKLVATFERQKVDGMWKGKSFSGSAASMSNSLTKPRTVKVYTTNL